LHGAEQLLTSSPLSAYQPATQQVRNAHSSGMSAPLAGLGAPAALILLATMHAFAGPQEDGQPRASRTPMGESTQNVTPQMFIADDTANKKSSPKISQSTAMAVGFFLWYAANVSFNIVNKQALGLFPHAWTVSCIQLATVVLCSIVGWVTGAIDDPRKSLTKAFLWRLLPAALCHALGNGLTSVAFSAGSVSFTHVVKTSEPVWMALGTFLIHGNRLPRPQILALLPIMLGVAVASAGELSFTYLGFFAALASTICFAGRGIFSKGLMSGENPMSPLNVYAMDSIMALFFTLPVAALADGQWFASGGMSAIFAAGHGSLLMGLLASTGWLISRTTPSHSSCWESWMSYLMRLETLVSVSSSSDLASWRFTHR